MTFANVTELIDFARGCSVAPNFIANKDLVMAFDADIVPILDNVVDADIVTEFNGMSRGDRTSPYRTFIYHVPVPTESSAIKYRDVKMNHADYDYDKIVAHAVKRGGDTILVNEEIYPFNALQPMYERVRAMCAYVHSMVFKKPTVFLDGDAFINADLAPVFDAIKHVAVTYRNDPGLMPINEGVIFAKPCDETRRFFRAYQATYERLAQEPKIIEYYGDIKRWRGGQLSLNALTCPDGMCSELDVNTVFWCDVQYLPCDIFNFAMDMGSNYSVAELNQKAVLHLKGPRKLLVDQIISYQEAR